MSAQKPRAGDPVLDPGNAFTKAWYLFLSSLSSFELEETGVTAGSYTNTDLTVDVYGRITAASNGSEGGIPSGTSFPGSPSTDDLFHRTDRDLIYFYDGTRWLTIDQYQVQLHRWSAFAQTVLTATTANVFLGDCIYTPTFDFWMETFAWSAFVNTTNTGTQYWQFVLKSDDATAGSETTIVTGDTSTSSANTYIAGRTTINALLGTSARIFTVEAVKVSTPGNVNFISSTVIGRLVG